MPLLRFKSPFADRRQRFEAGRLGMWLFIASLGMLFGASVIGFLVIRFTARSWPADLPPLPRLLWLSTAVLVAGSGTIQWALISARRGVLESTRRLMLATVALAALFLVNQAAGWWSWRAALLRWGGDDEIQRFALASYYVLTGVHAAHVIGGLVPLVFVTAATWRVTSADEVRPGVEYCAMYWHFLGVVWLALFALLMVGV